MRYAHWFSGSRGASFLAALPPDRKLNHGIRKPPGSVSRLILSGKALVKVIGTFILAFFGVGSAVMMGAQIGFHGIAMAFGLSIVAAAHELGAIPSAALNPAVSLGFLVSGRMGMGDFLTYRIAQSLGAVAAAAPMIVSGKVVVRSGRTVWARTAGGPAGLAGLAIGLTLAGPPLFRQASCP